MATYVIGDIHGCFRTLELLLERIGFAPQEDRIVLVGDLVNRGPLSLPILRWARGLGDRLIAVLGNHDLHLIATALGVRRHRAKDNLHNLFEAADGDDLIDWLRHRPLIHREPESIVVHAGFHPDWTVAQAEQLARDLESTLRGPGAEELLRGLYRKDLPSWSSKLTEAEQQPAALQALTSIRTIDGQGKLNRTFTGSLAELPDGDTPWFQVPERPSRDTLILFGHWAALGHHDGDGVISLDTGCSWGGSLTALRMEDRQLFQEPVADDLE